MKNFKINIFNNRLILRIFDVIVRRYMSGNVSLLFRGMRYRPGYFFTIS